MKNLTLKELKLSLQLNEEGQQYLNLIKEFKSRCLGLKKEKGFEIHHILPRSLGGKNSKTNLVKVTCFEHCLLHVLLAKSLQFPETLYPILRMSFKQFIRCSNLEQITLEDIYKWSKEREKASSLNAGRKFSEESRKKMSQSHKGQPGTTTGRVRIHKGRLNRIIKPEELGFYLKEGWEIGCPERTPEYRKNLSEACKKRAKPSEASKQKNREAHLGKSSPLKGSIYINKGTVMKRVPPQDVEKYLEQGWKRGFSDDYKERAPRCRCKHTDEWRRKVSLAQRGKIRIYKKEVIKKIQPEELPLYLKNGWTRNYSDRFKESN